MVRASEKQLTSSKNGDKKSQERSMDVFLDVLWMLGPKNEGGGGFGNNIKNYIH